LIKDVFIVVRTRRLLSTDTLEGNKVINQAGEDLGKIETFMVDPEQVRVAYAVLSFGGFLGIGDKLFANPMQALTLVPDAHKFLRMKVRNDWRRPLGLTRTTGRTCLTLNGVRAFTSTMASAPTGPIVIKRPLVGV
jgi:PRC-barrel domain